MKEKKPLPTLESAERRRFLEASGKFGFTAAAVAAAGGTLMSESAMAQTADEEKARQQAAKTTMTIGTAYRVGTTRSYPIMQLNLKENIHYLIIPQNLSRKRPYVNNKSRELEDSHNNPRSNRWQYQKNVLVWQLNLPSRVNSVEGTYMLN